MKTSKQILVLFSSLLLLLLTGCFSSKQSLIPTYNKGGYKMKIINSSSKTNNLRIYGKVFNVSNNEPMSLVNLSFGCIKTQTLTNGEYSMIIKNFSGAGNILIEAVRIGYKTIQTEFINVTNKNEINIDFYLHEDDTPLYNCEANF